MLSILLLDPHWEGLAGPIYASFFIVGTTIIGLVIGIIVEFRKDTAGSNGRALLGLAILLLLVMLLGVLLG
jgi:hypothetical protein